MMGVKLSDLDHNYTDEVKAFYDNRLNKLEHYAGQWPIRVAFSTVGNGHPTHEKGVRQTHLLCWLLKEDGVTYCGQGVYVLAIARNLYTVRADGIKQAIQSHIMQCHSEVIDHAIDTPAVESSQSGSDQHSS